ncbi:uncharacterized protein LOC109020074 [Juglans regia]|uniref:Uncharacterized protein LOC109020074 n=1 Tax=Juglans regia TaxID=51240 RepID=A0A6P9EGG2_JUGRE|nr:uncharacterized protein LOC109020074 [Juglans regia]
MLFQAVFDTESVLLDGILKIILLTAWLKPSGEEGEGLYDCQWYLLKVFGGGSWNILIWKGSCCCHVLGSYICCLDSSQCMGPGFFSASTYSSKHSASCGHAILAIANVVLSPFAWSYLT